MFLAKRLATRCLQRSYRTMSITWFYSFFVVICLLAFLLKTWIHLWNLSRTSFFASASNFVASSSSSQISHSSAIFHTSISFGFFSFLLFFLFLSASFFSSSSLCFCHPDFPCFGLYYFPHSSRHLIIFTSSVLQSISGL